MEEQKSKVVKMDPEVQETKKPEKLTYEQLENAAHQLSEQTKYLYDQLQKSNMNNVFKRLDYLFKVVENKEAFDPEFFYNCTKEIKEIMTVPEEKQEEQEDTNN